MATRRAALLLLAVVGACAVGACSHTYVAFGYDAAKQSHGGMSTMVTETPTTGSVGVGVGGRTGGVELRLQSYDTSSTTMSDRFAAASSSLEAHLVPVRLGAVALVLHAGPAVGAVLDTQMMGVTYGVGFRAGAGAEIAYHGVAMFCDVARQQLTFGGDVINGRGDRDVVSIGLRVGG